MSISKAVVDHPRPGCLGSVMLRNKDMEWPEWATPQGRARVSDGEGFIGLSTSQRIFPTANKDKTGKKMWCHSQYHTWEYFTSIPPAHTGARGDPACSSRLPPPLRPQMSPPSTVPSLSIYHLHSKFLLSTLYTAVNKTNRNPVPCGSYTPVGKETANTNR